MKIRGVRSGASPRGSIALVPGQMVRGRVLSKLRPGRFRIVARGCVFEAASDLPLEAGQRLVARVEMNGHRLLLRVQDESGYNAPSPEEENNPEEIRRILKALGHQPSVLDILEFQERLDRYKPHASLAGVEPSDLWILAILWTRGIRGGADAFALLSFYLRQWSLEGSAVPSSLPENADFVRHLCQKENTAENGNTPAPEDHSEGATESLSPGLDSRKREAIALLNREKAPLGCYGESDGASRVFLFRHGLNSNWQARLSDQPVLPGYVIELAQASGRARIRTHIGSFHADSVNSRAASWKDRWNEQLTRAGFEVEEHPIHATSDQEKLRCIFWRKWDKDYFCDFAV